MKTKVSVIIPVYNVEKYLNRCVDSVLNQTYKNLEIILVDDGSLDKSPQICEEYASKDSRVKVIHKKNGGLSSARNAALNSKLRGDYVTFVDSDDWIENDTIDYCLRILEQTKADVIQYNLFLTRKYIEHIKQPKQVLEIYTGKDILEEYLRRETYGVCRCMFHYNTLEKIRFREGKINEDIDFKYKVLQRCDKMVYSNQKKYYYFQTGNSISMGGLTKKDFDLYDAADELYKMTSVEDYGKIRFLGKVKKKRTPFSLLCKVAYYGVADNDINKKELIKSLVKEHRENVALLIKSPMSLSRKVLAILFAVNYNISEVAINMMKRFLVY